MTDEATLPTEPAEVELLQKERDDLRDRLLRTSAEFDNYRKRTERERRDLSETVSADIVRDVLPAVDDLDRALAAAAGDEAGQAFHRGLELIRRRLLDALRRRGVEPIDVIGQDFDPNWHEAVGHAEAAAGQRDGEITAELTKGYRIGQRLLRPAQVRVAKA